MLMLKIPSGCVAYQNLGGPVCASPQSGQKKGPVGIRDPVGSHQLPFLTTSKRGKKGIRLGSGVRYFSGIR